MATTGVVEMAENIIDRQRAEIERCGGYGEYLREDRTDPEGGIPGRDC